jgi:hypothetical protein
MRNALGELEDEVPDVDFFGKVDEILDVGGHALSGVFL